MGGPEADERAQPTPGKRKEDWQGHPPVLVPVERTHGGDPPAVTFQLWHGVEKPGLSLLSTHVPSFLRRRHDRRRFPFGAGVPPTKSFALGDEAGWPKRDREMRRVSILPRCRNLRSNTGLDSRMMLNRVHSEARGAIWLTNRDQRICGVSSEQIAVSSGTGPWHPAWKLVKSLPMGSPSQG